MSTLVNIDGRILPPEEAVISVFDRGFLFGDSVYETVRTYGGRPFLLGRHMTRLKRSADRLSIPLPGDVAGIEREILRTLAAAANPEAVLRICVTRGSRPGVVNLDMETAGDPTLVLIVRPFSGLDAGLYTDGVRVSVVSVLRNDAGALDPAIKSGNYLNNILALREARADNAFECLMLNGDGHLTECATSNVFLVEGGRLRTPAMSCGLLDGITRTFLIDVARDLGESVDEAALTVDDLASAEEVFITSSLKEVLPVTRVDDRTVGTGRPGARTMELLERYRAAAWRSVAGDA